MVKQLPLLTKKITQAEMFTDEVIRYLSFIHVKFSHIRQLPSSLLQRQGTDYTVTLSNIADFYGLNFAGNIQDNTSTQLNKILYITFFGTFK